jgi:hypothetical protein
VTKYLKDFCGYIKRMNKDKLPLPKQRMNSTESKEIRMTENKMKVTVLEG